MSQYLDFYAVNEHGRTELAYYSRSTKMQEMFDLYVPRYYKRRDISDEIIDVMNDCKTQIADARAKIVEENKRIEAIQKMTGDFTERLTAINDCTEMIIFYNEEIEDLQSVYYVCNFMRDIVGCGSRIWGGIECCWEEDKDNETN